jgi:HEPN domain-containing protein
MVSSSMSDDQQPESPAWRWLRLAQEDLAAARAILRSEGVAPRIACFLSQQAAEKALKAGLIAMNRQFPKIHGLTRLLALYPNTVRPELKDDDLDLLDPWIIDGRYAADLPAAGLDEASAMADIAERVVESVRLIVVATPQVP